MIDGTSKPTMSSARDTEPVIESERLPWMTDRARRPRRLGGKVRLMPEEPRPDAGTRGRMGSVPKTPPREQPRKRPRPDQQARPNRPRAAGEAYVRIRMRVENGELSVAGMSTVEGPLLTSRDLHGDLAYEVTIGDRRIAAGAVPDAGVTRSFPHPDPAPGQAGHHIAPAASYEFVARVPRGAISLTALRRLNVALYRIKEGPLTVPEGAELLGRARQKELREVARLRGVSLESLPRSIAQEVRRALR